jgi:hypothetical protein
MTLEPIGALILALGLIGQFLQPGFIVYAFFAATLLGAAGAIILGSLGGVSVQPAHLLIGFLVLRLLRCRDVRAGLVRAVAFGTPGFWLIITVAYASVTAYLLPRLLQGQTLVFPVRADRGQYYAAALAPSAANLTQSIYFVADCVCFLVLCGFGSTDSGRRCLTRAALLCLVLNLLFVVLDMTTYSMNIPEFMSPIRNATYSVLNEAGIAGYKRIVGSFTEASAFGYATVGYFAFAISLWLNGIAPRLTLALGALSFVALLFSTSTTAYAGLSGYLLVLYLMIAIRFVSSPVRRQMAIFLICMPVLAGIVAVLIRLNEPLYIYLRDLVDILVLDKMSTSSGIERSGWNAQAIGNFLDTFGFGAGNGSVRASSFPIAVIANLGILGAMVYGSFLLAVWRKGRDLVSKETSAVQEAARSACLGWLIAATASVGFVDLGLPFFAFAALACAPLTAPRWQPALGRTGLNSLSFAGAKL